MKLLSWGSFHKIIICVDRKALTLILGRFRQLMALSNHCRRDLPGAMTTYSQAIGHGLQMNWTAAPDWMGLGLFKGTLTALRLMAIWRILDEQCLSTRPSHNAS